MKKYQITQDGYTKLEKELEELTKKKRPKAITRLQTARAMGDLSENSEYTAAKEDLAFIEGRIQELEELMKNAQIVSHLSDSTLIDVGCSVTVEKDGEKVNYFIVGEFEANPMENKLSHSSPIGKALLGKKIGELVSVEVPAGKLVYKILDIKNS
jgi:transcription elongation factor GreA